MMFTKCPKILDAHYQPYVELGFKAAKEGRDILYMKEVAALLQDAPTSRGYWAIGWVTGGGNTKAEMTEDEAARLRQQVTDFWKNEGEIAQRLQELEVAKTQ
jgi:hypothetical protein